MTPRRIGLASRVNSVSLAELTRVAAALNVQISRDFQPIWQIAATVSALADPDVVPPGVWPIFVVDDTGFDGATGLHLTDANQPYAVVDIGDTWSLTASHECLEMLVDPSGNRLQTSTGIIVEGDAVTDAPGVKFDYLVEVADPSEDPANAYLIDDVLVSDFYTPSFFDPIAAGGVRYSFTGRLERPRQVLEGGYISWHDPATNRMRQLRFFERPEIVTLPGHPSDSRRRSLRGFVDSVTPPPIKLSHIDPETAAGGYRGERRRWLQSAAARHGAAFAAARTRPIPAAAASSADAVVAAIAANHSTLLQFGATRAYAGWHFENGWITRNRAIVVQAHKADVETVRAHLPAKLGGVAIDVRVDPRPPRTPAGATGMLATTPGAVRGELALPTMLPGAISQNSPEAAVSAAMAAASARPHKPAVTYQPPAGTPFRTITAQMTLRLHVSPDRGWPELQQFLTPQESELVVGMYQCTAPHIEAALTQGLGRGGKLTLTMDSPPDGKHREQTVEDTETQLDQALGGRLSFAWALSGLGKEAPAEAFPTAYHIKVAVKDGQSVWISSGNWNTANQPVVDPNDEASLAKAAQASDRDWHVICVCPEVASFFRDYLVNDYQTASGAAPGAAGVGAMAAAIPAAVDDLAGLMARKPKRYFDTKEINRQVTVRPLLTPDVGGYRAPILELIRGAKKRFYMQTQYIHTVDASNDTDTPSHMDLIAAVADRIAAGVDVKLITSEYQDAMWIERLQDAGVDAVDHLRIQQRVHNKGIVVDSSIAVISSQNWSSQGTGGNRDAGLIIYDEEAAQYLEEIFLHDWINMAAARIPG
jgi:hypothetical protein